MNNDIQINRKRLADQIADQLVRMIENGTFAPGDRLPSEPELMKQFNVGRSSIREAVGALSLLGLITVRPGHGTHVARFTPEEVNSFGLAGLGTEKVHELVQARIELEGVIARLAAEMATVEDIEFIRESHQNLRNAKARGHIPMEQDFAFHLAVAKACHNSILIKFFTEMRHHIRQWMKQKAKYDWGYDQVVEQHDLIIKAIEQGDGTAAEKALKSHLRSTGEKLVAAMLERPTTA